MYFYTNSSQPLFDGCSGDIKTLAFLVCPARESSVAPVIRENSQAGSPRCLQEGAVSVQRNTEWWADMTETSALATMSGPFFLQLVNIMWSGGGR